MPNRLETRPAQPWTSVDWDAHVRDVTVRGRRLRYVDLGAGAGPPLFLVHGTGGSWQSWLLNLVDLSRHRRVIAVDLPGFGASEAFGPAVQMASLADALVGLLDLLGIDRVVPVGHSLGGIVVLRMALHHPDRVASVVVVNGGGVAMSERRLEAVIRVLLLANAALSRPAVLHALVTRPRLRRRMLSRAMYDPTAMTPDLARATLATFAAPGLVDAVAAGARDDIAQHVHAVQCRTLLIWGRHDRLLPLSLAQELVSRVPQIRLEVVEGAGHCPMIERPHVFNDLIERWTV
jgi:pimeloyl-ACP methyl ester carboxylesterase